MSTKLRCKLWHKLHFHSVDSDSHELLQLLYSGQYDVNMILILIRIATLAFTNKTKQNKNKTKKALNYYTVDNSKHICKNIAHQLSLLDSNGH